MVKSWLLTAAGVVLFSSSAFAGWYKVENYAGLLADGDFYLSLQTYDFGNGITVEGSAYFDGDHTPVALYGRDVDGVVQLCRLSTAEEIQSVLVEGSTAPSDTADCGVSLTVNSDGVTGIWTVEDGPLDVELGKAGSLDDTGTGEITGTMEVPFWSQTETHMFVGVYSKADSSICMEKLRVIDKQTSKVDQEIAFDQGNCNAGVVMTPIYLNVETRKSGDEQIVSVNFLDNQGGYSKDYVESKKTRKLVEKR